MTFTKLNEVMDILVKMRAYNGMVWSSSEILPQIRIKLLPIIPPDMEQPTVIDINVTIESDPA